MYTSAQQGVNLFKLSVQWELFCVARSKGSLCARFASWLRTVMVPIGATHNTCIVNAFEYLFWVQGKFNNNNTSLLWWLLALQSDANKEQTDLLSHPLVLSVFVFPLLQTVQLIDVMHDYVCKLSERKPHMNSGLTVHTWSHRLHLSDTYLFEIRGSYSFMCSIHTIYCISILFWPRSLS